MIWEAYKNDILYALLLWGLGAMGIGFGLLWDQRTESNWKNAIKGWLYAVPIMIILSLYLEYGRRWEARLQPIVDRLIND